MAITRLSGGLTPADGSDPRTFPEIFNEAADEIESLPLQIYPVGSIYMSVLDTNPATLFGGTWASFGQGRVLVGVDPNDSDFNDSDKTGGAKTHTLTTAEMPSHGHTQNSHNHTQNSHNHSQNGHLHEWQYRGTAGGKGGSSGRVFGDVNVGNQSTDFFLVPDGSVGTPNTLVAAQAVASPARTFSTTASNNAATAGNNANTATNQTTGGGGAHNNVQPFITVFMFQRTA